MEYKGIKLFGTDNFEKEPIAHIESDMAAYRHDAEEFVSFADCPVCGMNNLSRIVCQFCGQRFIESEVNL